MKILVVDDEQAVRESLRRSLTFNGYEVILAQDGEDALAKIRSDEPDLTILDLMMPKVDGLEVCRILRSSGYDRPVLILTARDGVAERVAGLDAGADDYLAKPFALEELLARVRSLMRRTRLESQSGARTATILKFDDLEVDIESREVRRGDHDINLTRTEFSLLKILISNPRKVLSRETILQEVWGQDFPSSGNALEVYVGYLRRKIEVGGASRLIHTVRGVGYVMRETAE